MYLNKTFTTNLLCTYQWLPTAVRGVQYHTVAGIRTVVYQKFNPVVTLTILAVRSVRLVAADNGLLTCTINGHPALATTQPTHRPPRPTCVRQELHSAATRGCKGERELQPPIIFLSPQNVHGIFVFWCCKTRRSPLPARLEPDSCP